MNNFWKLCALGVALFASSGVAMAQTSSRSSTKSSPDATSVNLFSPQRGVSNSLHAQLERCTRLRAGDGRLKQQLAEHPFSSAVVNKDASGRVREVAYMGKTTTFEYASPNAQTPVAVVQEGHRLEIPQNVSTDQRKKVMAQLRMRKLLFAQVRAQCGLAPITSLSGQKVSGGPDMTAMSILNPDDPEPDFPAEWLTQDFWTDFWRNDMLAQWDYDAALGRPRQCQPLPDCFAQCDTEAEESLAAFGFLYGSIGFAFPPSGPFMGFLAGFTGVGIYFSKKECKEVLCQQPCPK